MKKFLSLVLALVMTMSLVTVSAGAKDFTDNSKINYKEAVDVMSAVKVIDGYAEGDFRPSATLTRGAAAKIICNLILGPTTASALVADAAPYKDVPTNHTFAGYIAYCQKEKIISGYADGTFRPAASLTGYAFMKMLLGALGYDAEVEQYTGANWSINVAKRAMNIGLKDGLIGDFNGVKAVTREEACLYAFNTLQATMVEYSAKTSVSTNGTTVVIAGSEAKDVVNTGKTDSNIDKDGKMQFAEKYFEDLKLDKTSDDFGRPANKWNVKKEEVGTYANTPDATFTKKVTKADVYNAIGKTVYDDLKDGDATLTTYFDGDGTKVKAADVDSTWANKNDTGKVNSTGNGDLTEIYVDDDNNVTIVTIRTYVFQAATDYDAKKESVNLTQDGSKADNLTNAAKTIVLNDRTVEAEDYAVVKDLKADDYVLVTAVKNGSGYDVKSVEKAEVKAVEVSGYKLNDSVDAASTTYKYNANADSIKGTSYNVGKQATLVLDKYGYIIAVEESVVLSDYVYIEKFGSTSSLNAKALANAIFADGTDAEITVKEVLGVKNKTTIANYGTSMAGWYTYSKNTANEYTLYRIESKYDQKADSFSGITEVSVNGKVNPIMGTKLNGVLANDDTVILVSDKDDDITVYTGVKNFPGVKLTSASSKATVSAVVKTSNGYASLVYIDVDGSATITGDKNSNLVYVVEYDGKYVTKDNETFYKYTVLDGEDEVKIEADNQIQNITGSVYGVANYLTKSGDRYTDFQLVKQDKDVVVYGTGTKASDPIKQSAGTLVLAAGNNSTGKFVVASDAKITLVTTKGAAVLNKDADADYEVSANMTAKELVDALATADTYTYTYAGKTTDSDNEVLKELYVTVTAATTSNSGNGSNSAKGEGSATINYTVASNGTLRYTINYTAPEYAADGAHATVKVDVLANGKYFDTLTIAKDLKNGEFTYTGKDSGYPDDEELTFEIFSEEFDEVVVNYVDAAGKALTVGGDKTAKFGSLKVDLTSNDGTFKVTKVDGASVSESLPTADITAGTGTSLTVTAIDGTKAVTVTIDTTGLTTKTYTVATISSAKALSALYKTGTTTLYTGDGAAITVTVAASKDSGIKSGEKVGIEVTASAVAKTSDPMKVTLNIGGTEFVLNCVNNATAVKASSTITVTGDVAEPTVTKVEKLATPTVTSITAVDALDNGYLDKATGAVDSIVVTFSEKVKAAPAISGTTLAFEAGVLAADGMSATYAVTTGLANATATDTVTIAAEAIEASSGCFNPTAVSYSVKGLTFTAQ